jgi:hypothetical protein
MQHASNGIFELGQIRRLGQKRVCRPAMKISLIPPSSTMSIFSAIFAFLFMILQQSDRKSQRLPVEFSKTYDKQKMAFKGLFSKLKKTGE